MDETRNVRLVAEVYEDPLEGGAAAEEDLVVRLQECLVRRVSLHSICR